MAHRRHLFAIGGSAGSGTLIKRLLSELPANFPASIVITTHVPSTSRSVLAEILARHARMPVDLAKDRQPLETGRIYLAPPDRHLLVMGDTLRLGAGPKENLSRPAIDPMFRSAALSHGPGVVGIVLSGMLNDGAAGLYAIREQGGIGIVQDPADAEFDPMPTAAMEAGEVDHVVPGAEIAKLMISLAGASPDSSANGASHAGLPGGDALRLEVDIAMGHKSPTDAVQAIAQPTTLTCPDCLGVLSEIKDSRPLRFRCQVGHAYTAEVLDKQSQDVEDALRMAMRLVEERVTLVERMARDARGHGRNSAAELYEQRGREYRSTAEVLRRAAIASMNGKPWGSDLPP